MKRDKTIVTLEKTKRIALIAHDNLKENIIGWCLNNKDILSLHTLCGTGTTASLVAEKTGLPVHPYRSGPLGGDQQIGAQIAEGAIDIVIFFADPLTAQPHDPDVKALMRICQVYDIPMAITPATADFLISSPFMDTEYVHRVIDYGTALKDRLK